MFIICLKMDVVCGWMEVGNWNEESVDHFMMSVRLCIQACAQCATMRCVVIAIQCV